jgi:hypothetical protein
MADDKWIVNNVGSDPFIVVNQDARTPVMVRLTEWHDHLRVDVRQIWSPKDNEHFQMTKKGAAIPIEDIDAVIEFLLSAKAFVEGREDDDGK